jgi:hypothetical protein
MFYLNLNEALSLCLHELGSLVDDNVLFLVSLTTTHGETGLPTSKAHVEAYVRSAHEGA